ncbi:MAG: FdhF/YdeP family oxidoreductase [Halioglobus sp.]|nr:FdhF/YdeP family oxidoreductase [Halioglobus sp.]
MDQGSKTGKIIGGGAKKVLYTLGTVGRIGVINSAKALTSRNACKACGLGMGGQQGGMTNEGGEFPSVCNKSVQAQSTDIQPPIPKEIFKHSLEEFKQLSAKEIESLGRLNTPLFKAKDRQRFEPVSWTWALDCVADRFGSTPPEKSFFYTSGRSSNEAGFVLQLLARLYGTNNVNNCSYYCHQATSVGLRNTIGTGTATIELEDLDHCDLIFVIGANPASNHPRFIHKLQACRERGGEIIMINPAREPGLVRFAVPKSARSMIRGGSNIASAYLQPHIGADRDVLTAIGKAVLEKGSINRAFIDANTTGFDAYRQQLENADWCTLCTRTGLSRDAIEDVAARYNRSKKAVFAWGMGITHHQHGVQNVESIVNLCLLRGMIGSPHAGLLPLRGHSNVQGIGTIGVKPVLPQQVFDALEAELDITLPTSPGLDTLACLTRAHEGNMDAAIIMGGNLYEATPDSHWAAAALDNIGTKVFLTTTLNRGHLHGLDRSEAFIFPVTARDEEWQATTQESMFNYVRLSDGGIARLDNVRPEVEVLCDIASRLIPAELLDFTAFKSHQTIRQAIARVVPGMEELADIGVAKKEFHVRRRLLHQPDFKTDSGKAAFIFREGEQASVTRPEFPFRLMSVRSEGQFNSIIYEENDSYRGACHRWVVFIGGADIERLGIQPGQRVTLRSERAAMHAVEVLEFGLPAGNLMAYYPEANVLTSRAADPRSHTPAFKSIPVQIDVS